MRVLMCPDGFTGTLSALEASRAMADGWRRTNPNDELVLMPLSDGGPGFIDAVISASTAIRRACQVLGPTGELVMAEYALLDEHAWIESAQACGLHLIRPDVRDPGSTSTFGVGQMILDALTHGVRQITIGLGGSGTNDGGAGMLAALGAVGFDAEGKLVDLTQGGLALEKIARIDISAATDLMRNVEVIVATDVDNPLLGLRGATATFAQQKGADDALIMKLEGALERFAAHCGKREDGKDPSVALGAGAAGGLGFALLLLGGTRVAGISTVMDIVGFRAALEDCDVALTGEGCLDDQSLHGKVIVGVARECATAGVPCVVVAGQVRLGKRDCAAAGIDGAYSVVEFEGIEQSLADAPESLSRTVARVARTWGRR
ncbi:MAG: glycerate kinase [Actinobacteria bacterium]|uniref:Unannotated protein n=1 Tax=freshwater metagenome TaxID=449393 RepID=A0A6J5ZRZ4_9ZZZZ|nr:glycerate kinase [Actinomycetota bacterium]